MPSEVKAMERGTSLLCGAETRLGVFFWASLVNWCSLCSHFDVSRGRLNSKLVPLYPASKTTELTVKPTSPYEGMVLLYVVWVFYVGFLVF